MDSAAVISTLWPFSAFRLHLHTDPVVSVLQINPMGICSVSQNLMNDLRKPGEL